MVQGTLRLEGRAKARYADPVTSHLAAAEVEVCWCKFFESCSLCFGRA